jgi:glycosyltransferase involved in cell wall biosynthesis
VGSRLLPRLVARGHVVRAVAPLAAQAGDPDDTGRHPGIAVRRYPVPAWELRPGRPDADLIEHERRILPQLVTEVIRDDAPDVAILGRESFARWAPTVLRSYGVPTVLLAHATSGGGAFSGTVPAEDRVRLLGHFATMAAIVVVARNLEGRYTGLGPPVHVIQNGVDLARFAPRPRDQRLAAMLGFDAADVVVGHLSNLKDLKRPLDVVSAAERAATRADRLRFLVIGDGPLRRDMERAVARAGLTDRFRFTGWMEEVEVARHLAVVDVVAMPSSREALALAYLETMASGRVLVASDLPASRELLTDGHDGFLHAVGDVASLANLLVSLAEQPDLRAAVGRRARTTAERFGIEAFTDGVAAVLTRSVTGAGTAGNGPPAGRRAVR